MSVQSTDEIERLVTEFLVGRQVRELQIVGINALKTVEPSTTALMGSTVDAASVRDRQLVIKAGDYVVRVDLQRTGRVVPITASSPWSPREGTPAPTARLLLADGTALDFGEPARTKRITVAITVGP